MKSLYSLSVRLSLSSCVILLQTKTEVICARHTRVSQVLVEGAFWVNWNKPWLGLYLPTYVKWHMRIKADRGSDGLFLLLHFTLISVLFRYPVPRALGLKALPLLWGKGLPSLLFLPTGLASYTFHSGEHRAHYQNIKLAA